MPIGGDYDLSYPNRLILIGLELNEPFRGSKQHHSLRCLECNDIFNATPISKLQNFKKHQLTGCPTCCKYKKYENSRQQNKQSVADKGLVVLTIGWTGQRVLDKDNSPIYLDFYNPTCGHTFNCSVTNILTRGITCTMCGIKQRTTNINKSSKDRSDEWKKTADIWQKYKSKVTKLTKQSYKNNKHKINPDNLPTGRAGTEGAYHIDHIVPVRYCFEHFIPEELCAHPDNLQMLGWRENVGSRDKLKDVVPLVLDKYIKENDL